MKKCVSSCAYNCWHNTQVSGGKKSTQQQILDKWWKQLIGYEWESHKLQPSINDAQEWVRRWRFYLWGHDKDNNDIDGRDAGQLQLNADTMDWGRRRHSQEWNWQRYAAKSYVGRNRGRCGVVLFSGFQFKDRPSLDPQSHSSMQAMAYAWLVGCLWLAFKQQNSNMLKFPESRLLWQDRRQVLWFLQQLQKHTPSIHPLLYVSRATVIWLLHSWLLVAKESAKKLSRGAIKSQEVIQEVALLIWHTTTTVPCMSILLVCTRFVKRLQRNHKMETKWSGD